MCLARSHLALAREDGGSGNLYAPPPQLAPPLLLTFGEGEQRGRGGEVEQGPTIAPCATGYEGEEGGEDAATPREGLAVARGREVAARWEGGAA
jgi:hypothetical protein